MAQKHINARFQNKHDTEANWLLATDFIPKQGEIIVYDTDENHAQPRFKIGDGTSDVNTLSFSGEGEKIYKQNDEPTDAEDGALWIDLDQDESDNIAYTTTYAHNLLDNSNFTNPVNQRRLTSLVANASAYQYFLDRWLHADFTGTPATFTLTDDGITVTNGTGYFYQRYEKGYLSTSITYTLAIHYADGTVDVRQKAYPIFVVSVGSEDYDQIYFTVDAGKTVSKVALYEGKYTIDTLPEYQPKGYAAELAECQRYAFAIGPYAHIRMATKSANTIQIIVPTPNMRVTPTFTGDYTFRDISSGSDISGFEISAITNCSSFCRLDFVKTSHGLSDAYLRTTGICLLSADL